MADRRRHRGAHPNDAQLFSQAALPVLRDAVDDLCWLLGRGYPPRSAVALIGDRYDLVARQRTAVLRCACSEQQRVARQARATSPASEPGAPVWIDGFNVLTTVEAALGGGVLLLARDGAMRDMASMHGSYRLVEETPPALDAITRVLREAEVKSCRWLLDAPVSNSGRLGALIRSLGEERGLAWSVEVVRDPDQLLGAAPAEVIVASADSRVMDCAAKTWQLAREVVGGIEPTPWIFDLG